MNLSLLVALFSLCVAVLLDRDPFWSILVKSYRHDGCTAEAARLKAGWYRALAYLSAVLNAAVSVLP